MITSASVANEASRRGNTVDSAQEIAQAAGHCKEIIQQLSALSRKNVETVYKRLDAGEAFGRVMKMVRSICPDNVELDIDLDFGGAAFLGNETQLSQVVLNMAVNAVHAIGQKEGHIAITGRALGKEELEERGAVDVLAADGGLEEERALDFCLSFQGKYPRLMKLLLVERPTREVLEAKNRGLIQGWLEKPVSAQAILEEAHRLRGEQAAGATTL